MYDRYQPKTVHGLPRNGFYMDVHGIFAASNLMILKET